MLTERRIRRAFRTPEPFPEIPPAPVVDVRGWLVCSDCDGTGELLDAVCVECAGRGKVDPR